MGFLINGFQATLWIKLRKMIIMKKFFLPLFAVLLSFSLKAQEVYFGEAKTLLSSHKEWEKWKGDIRVDANTEVGVQFKIHMSNKHLKIEEPNSVLEFEVETFNSDKYGNYTFFDAEMSKITYLRTKGIVVVALSNSDELTTYYLQ